MPGSRKLGRTSDHRKAMLRAMVTFLLENGRIETTVTRAKEVRSMAEKMITTWMGDDIEERKAYIGEHCNFDREDTFMRDYKKIDA